MLPVMQRMRRRLRRLAGGWLAFQLCILMAPMAVCLTIYAGAAGVECTCRHEHVLPCPMHHPESISKAPSCSCRSAADPLVRIGRSLSGPSAVLARPPESFHLIVTIGRPRGPARSPIDAVFVPEPPPPRS